MARTTNPNHPTRESLIDTAVALLDGKCPDEITVEDILTVSGISTGSLYHHFGDLHNLVESAMIVRFSRGVDWSIDAIGNALRDSKDSRDFAARLHQITLDTQSPERSDIRAERIRAIAFATTSDRFRAALAPEQQRLTDGIAEVWQLCQERGLMTTNIDPRAGSLFIQAYTLGLILNEVSTDPVPFETWVALIDTVASNSLIGIPTTESAD